MLENAKLDKDPPGIPVPARIGHMDGACPIPGRVDPDVPGPGRGGPVPGRVEIVDDL